MLMKNRSRRWRVLLWLTGVPLLFALYTPDSHIIHRVSTWTSRELLTMPTWWRTPEPVNLGAVSTRLSVLYQWFQGVSQPHGDICSQSSFLLFPPSILLTRIFSAFWVFASCLLLGLLAKRISQLKIGVIVAASLLTPGF